MQNYPTPVRLVVSLSPETFCGLSNIAEEYGLTQNEAAANCIQSSVADWLAACTSVNPEFMPVHSTCKEMMQ